MSGTAIEPTITQQVRAFLSQQGASLPPWSGLDETYAELYALLNRRRADPSFWPPVRTLLQQIIASSTDPSRPDRLPAAQAELLASWDVEQLMGELRAALPGDDQPVDSSVVRRFLAKLSAGVMGGFLLLGLAASGCSDKGNLKVDRRQPDRSAADLGSWSASCRLQSSSVLWTSIDQSQLPERSKRSLCACFAALSTSWSDGLTSLFQSGTSTQIATVLEEMVRCCQQQSSCEELFEDPNTEGHATPVYKGVSFPE